MDPLKFLRRAITMVADLWRFIVNDCTVWCSDDVLFKFIRHREEKKSARHLLWTELPWSRTKINGYEFIWNFHTYENHYISYVWKGYDHNMNSYVWKRMNFSYEILHMKRCEIFIRMKIITFHTYEKGMIIVWFLTYDHTHLFLYGLLSSIFIFSHICIETCMNIQSTCFFNIKQQQELGNKRKAQVKAQRLKS